MLPMVNTPPRQFGGGGTFQSSLCRAMITRSSRRKRRGAKDISLWCSSSGFYERLSIRKRRPPEIRARGERIITKKVSQADWTVAAWRATATCCRLQTRERKVRAPQDAVVGNAHRPTVHPSRGGLEGQGKCNRKYTALA